VAYMKAPLLGWGSFSGGFQTNGRTSSQKQPIPRFPFCYPTGGMNAYSEKQAHESSLAVTEKTYVTTEPEIEIRKPGTLAQALTEPAITVVKPKSRVRKEVVSKTRRPA